MVGILDEVSCFTSAPFFPRQDQTFFSYDYFWIFPESKTTFLL
jgi:hypothetical protein